MLRLLLAVVIVQFSCNTPKKISNSDTIILNNSLGNHIEDFQQTQSRSSTSTIPNRYYSNLGAEFLLFDSPITGFNNNEADNVSVIKVKDKYAVLQAKEAYLFSWFKIGNESDDITLQRAIDFVFYTRIDGKNFSNGEVEKNKRFSTSGTILIDQNITLKNTVEIYENVTLKGDFTASNDNNFKSNVIYLDINDKKKAAIKFRRWPGANLNYVSARIEGIRFAALSPCRTVLDLQGAEGEVLKNVMLSCKKQVDNGFEVSSAIFCKISNVRVEKPKLYGVYLKNNIECISTTTEVDHCSIADAEIGIFVEHKSCNSLWLKNCVIEETNNSAIKIEQYNTVHVENLYTENVINETYKSGVIPIIDINSVNFGEEGGNKGLVTITNSIILGYRKSFPTRKIPAIYVGNLDMLNVTGCRFYLIDQSIIMKSSCDNVNWFNNSEPGVMNVYNALNKGNPIDNGIENPNGFNVISSYSTSSGKYEPFSRLVSTKSRLHTPILLSRRDNRLRIAEEGKDESKNFTEMWVQYGQQSGELRISPGGQNVAATFGTNGGVTIGNKLETPPPTDGLRVNGQAVFGSNISESSAALQIDSSDKGFLPPRMTTSQRDEIKTPVAGLIIFNTDVKKHQGFDGTTWFNLY